MLITVFTPTYNRADKLHRAYNSLRSQTLKKINNEYIFEWMIVDDGSIDNTRELVEQWKNLNIFPIKYIYQSNSGKIAALRKGIELSHADWFLQLDSDDACKEDAIEVFYNTITNLSQDELEKCGGIGALSEDQYGNPLGKDYPIENELLYTLDIIFKWRELGLGDTWALLKTENLKKSFIIPEEAKGLKFIPETFFWDRIAFELRPYSYFINKRLGIVYRGEGGNISENIRKKYPEGFLFESKWFVNKYKNIFIYAQKTYSKHMIKYILYSNSLNISFTSALNELEGWFPKTMFLVLYIPSQLIKNKYFKGEI